MIENDSQLIITDLKRRLSVIENNISDIVERQYVFGRFFDFARENNIPLNDCLLSHMFSNHVDMMIIDVCKQVDSRSESIINLLKDIKRNRKLFTLDKNNVRISTQKIDEDIIRIQDAIKGKIFGKKKQSKNSICKIRNKRKAHFNKGSVTTTATMRDLDSAIDILEQMVLKYELLLNQACPNGLLAGNIDSYIEFEKIFIKNYAKK